MFPNNKFNKICTFAGFAPISLNPRTQHILSAYSWLITVGILISAKGNLKADAFGDGYGLSNSVNVLIYFAASGGYITAIVESLVKRKQQLQYFTKLQELDDIFRCNLHHKMATQFLRRKLLTKYTFVSMALLVALLFMVGHFLIYNRNDLLYWYEMISRIASWIRFIQASVYVELICFRFKQLNMLLTQIANCRLILDVDHRPIDNPKRVVLLKTVYAKLYDIVDCINDNFGWSVLSFISYYCLSLIATCYWLLGSWDGYIPLTVHYECIAVFSSMGLMTVVYCSTCNNCVGQSIITRKLILNIIQNSPDGRLNYLLDDFLLQIQHLPIVIHAKRFFSIDLKLLCKICTTIIAYLVVLLQFRYSENVV